MPKQSLEHEPAQKKNGESYLPYFLDDSGDLQGFRGLLCRHCHSYYADPSCPPLKRQDNLESMDWPVELPGTNVCPAKLLELLRQTVL